MTFRNNTHSYSRMFFLILSLLFILSQCQTMRVKNVRSDEGNHSGISISKFKQLSSNTDGFAGKFTAEWKNSKNETVSETILMKVQFENRSGWKRAFYMIWAVVSGYSLTVIPFYAKGDGKLFLKSEDRGKERIYDAEFKMCISILLLNCALFEDFQPAEMTDEERMEFKLKNYAVSDYLRSEGRLK